MIGAKQTEASIGMEELFRQDSYLRNCEAVVTASGAEGIALDRTVFYPTGGGQPGDIGRLLCADGSSVEIVDTRKGATPGEVLHMIQTVGA